MTVKRISLTSATAGCLVTYTSLALARVNLIRSMRSLLLLIWDKFASKPKSSQQAVLQLPMPFRAVAAQGTAASLSARCVDICTLFHGVMSVQLPPWGGSLASHAPSLQDHDLPSLL